MGISQSHARSRTGGARFAKGKSALVGAFSRPVSFCNCKVKDVLVNVNDVPVSPCKQSELRTFHLLAKFALIVP